MNGKRSAGVVAVVLVAASTLAGCSQSPVAAKPPVTPTASPAASAVASTSPTPSPALTFDPSGSAADNKAFFDTVNTALFAANGSANGRDIIDNLVKSGFDKSAMQVTPDTTTIGARADAILFSVRIGKSCLLGQRGSVYSSAVEPALSDGKCLVGKTRAIDW
jgi:ABC-type transport system substrate-binding protein